MPVSMSDLSRNRRSFLLHTDVGDIRFTYRPYQMTPAREAEIRRLTAQMAGESDEDEEEAEAEAQLFALVTQFCDVVESTDMIGPLYTSLGRDGLGNGECLVPDGEPVLIQEELVKHFSSTFIIQVLQGIGEDMRPKSRTRKN